MASAATRMAPATSFASSCWANPSMMYRPRVPPPVSAARGTVAITVTAEVRRPAMISGAANGISNRISTSRSDRPIPRAASTVSGSTPWIAT